MKKDALRSKMKDYPNTVRQTGVLLGSLCELLMPAVATATTVGLSVASTGFAVISENTQSVN